MPVVGNRKQTEVGSGYKATSDRAFTESFLGTVKDILNETGVDLYRDPMSALQIRASRDALKNFYCENCVDTNEFELTDPANAAQDAEDAQAMYEELFDNDVEGLINENAALSQYNPVIGMTFPVHKNILMNNVFDKGAIPKFVAREPKFTVSMEQRYFTSPDGTEINLFKEQYKIYDEVSKTAPIHAIELTLPHSEDDTDILALCGGTADDNISIDTFISKVQVKNVQFKAGDIDPETGKPVDADITKDTWYPVKLMFTPNYGEMDRIMAQKISIECSNLASTGEADKTITIDDTLMGYMKNNKIMLSASKGNILAVELSARLDTSSANLPMGYVHWKVRTDIVEIGPGIPINTTVSPEEVKDLGALYNVNQLSKILSIMKTVLGDYKDTAIKKCLDDSFRTMDVHSKFATTFDFAPRAGYALDHVEWRQKTFMDYLDSVATGLFQVLNDPNMTISIFGAPELIRKITPTEYTYQTPSNIGPVELDFTKTVVTSDKRVYQFISSDKLRGCRNLIIILCPRNSDRIVYRIYDYQLYISNEIRNIKNPALPAVHAFERWKFYEYQPVQGRIRIEHPTGLVDIAPNDTPIDEFGEHMSDFNLIK